MIVPSFALWVKTRMAAYFPSPLSFPGGHRAARETENKPRLVNDPSFWKDSVRTVTFRVFSR